MPQARISEFVRRIGALAMIAATVVTLARPVAADEGSEFDAIIKKVESHPDEDGIRELGAMIEKYLAANQCSHKEHFDRVIEMFVAMYRDRAVPAKTVVEVVDRYRGLATEERQIEMLSAKGAALIELDEWDKALAVATELLKLNKDEAANVAVVLCDGPRDHHKALEVANALLELEGFEPATRACFLRRKGDALVGLNKFDEAKAVVSELEPIDAELAHGLALHIVQATADLAARIELADDYLEHADGEFKARLMSQKCVALARQGHCDDAEAIVAELRGIKEGFGEAVLDETLTNVATLPGMHARDFELKDLEGHAVKLESFRGKYVLLDFWGAWCGPCEGAAAHLKTFHDEYAEKGLVILGLNDEDADTQKAFAETHGVEWLLLHDPAIGRDSSTLHPPGETKASYGIEAIPYWILIDDEGKVVLAGISTAEGVTEKFAERLAEHFKGE